MKTVTNNKSSEISTYKRIEFLLSQSVIDANEDEGSLKYKNSGYELRGWLSGEEFEYEYLVNGEHEELEEPEQDLIFRTLEKEIENERINANYNIYEEPYYYATNNAY